jgi:hypothetical protein
MLVFSVCGLQQVFDDILRMIIYFCSYTGLLLGGLALHDTRVWLAQVHLLQCLPAWWAVMPEGCDIL